LQLIAHRRNQIVYEFGCDPVALGARHPIDLVLVTGRNPHERPDRPNRRTTNTCVGSANTRSRLCVTDENSRERARRLPERHTGVRWTSVLGFKIYDVERRDGDPALQLPAAEDVAF